ncbi:Methyl-accepting chemotaxis protein [Solibacillus isronensis B3W22]|uniref:Methyl-accepting chemotaxis protein n=1 Tax=Solibacillus isronensis B3W22 TaxID=1224748 RepID=K1KTW8_9BACL|nr:methyl-accepting chemotaxis protein [Solibacillus isronensis]AMO86470.1 chemotaxis protein [Solibacillus silvestris]EKB43307.1 Methyl-accepting chemotaxis protein [Solibacillus isronensis B3W22]
MKKQAKSKPDFHSSIKSKLIGISILLLIVPMIVIGMTSYQKSSTSLEQIGKTNLQNSVEFTLATIEAYNSEVSKGTISLESAQEKVKGIILGEKNGDGTRKINASIDLGENGYMIVYSQEGTRIAHPSKEGASAWDDEDENGIKFAQEMIKIANNGGGFTFYNSALPNNKEQIEEKVSYSKVDPNWEWVVTASTYMTDFNQPATELFNIILIVSGISIILGVIIIWFSANLITKPILKVTEQMGYLANGDLTKELLLIKSKDEISRLADAMNLLHKNLRNSMKKVSETSETLTSHSEELSQSADEVKMGSEQVASTVQELAAGSETQANNASDLASVMNTFVETVQEANESGLRIEGNSKAVLSMTSDGAELMKQSIQQMEKIHSIVNESVEKVAGLDKQSQEISNLVTVIKDVADQTNLLALNAAIEAARAGEHGKGFAVVADEVRKLAEQVSNSVTDITGIVDNIQKETFIVSDSLKVGYKEVELGKTQIESTGETFEGISVAVTEMVNSITTIGKNLSEISASTQEMNSSVVEIASVSEESAAGIEQTSASVQQTSSIMEEVAGSSKHLANLAEELNTLVREFKL